MTNLNTCLAGVMAAAVGVWSVAAPARADLAASPRQGDVARFCKAHPNLDFPGPQFFGAGYTPGKTPPQISKLGDSLQWRCMNGAVLVCQDSADGDWCSRKAASRTPSALLRQACREDPDKASFNFAEEHYSAFDWRCKAGRPMIVQSYPLDRQGFFKASWTPLIVRRGVVVGPTDFPPGPR
jgi:hypothetical protein